MSEARIRILIVDDHAVVRKGLGLVLRLEPDFEVVGEAGDGQRAIDLSRTVRPDLVLLDLMMPGLSAEETILGLRSMVPDVRVLVLTGAELDEGLPTLLEGGVDGYVLKDIEPDELAQAIRAVASGESYLHPVAARRILDKLAEREKYESTVTAHLTPRELEVLCWMATPATYREIGEQLVVSEETVRSHAKSILSKLQQPNRAQAVLAAVRAGLIDLPQ